jgi:hypothetical protein
MAIFGRKMATTALLAVGDEALVLDALQRGRGGRVSAPGYGTLGVVLIHRYLEQYLTAV